MYNLKEALVEHFTVTRVAFADGALRHETKTPAHHFINVIKPLPDSDTFVFTSARDSFDGGLCAAMMQFADQQEPSLRNRALDRGVSIVEGFQHDGYGFDSIVLFGPAYHAIYKEVDSWLHAHAIEICPIYRCEFVGDESPDEAAVVRRYGACTIDWTREPSPIVYMRWRNYVTDAGSVGQDFVYQSQRVLLSELRELSRDAKGWIEFQNFRREKCRVVIITPA
jgi:hypothetical protein